MHYSALIYAATVTLTINTVSAQETPAAMPDTLKTVVVTGTHISDRTVGESQSPIDILTPETLQSTGTSELATALSRALPSLNFPRPALADGTSGIRPAQLRGLSPDEVLVLIDGKRRHTAAQINLNGTIGRGSTAVDLNAIPLSAIERVEVLRDGASAQYGSDAIAGVINIVLKGSGDGGSLTVDHGRYTKGDGASALLSGDAGIHFAGDRGALHVAGQHSQAHHTNRSGLYQGATPNTGNFPNVGQKAFIIGDPDIDMTAVSANAALALGSRLTAYATAIASNRDITSFAFYRSRNHQGQGALLTRFYPNGYVPEIDQSAKDRSLVLGIKQTTGNGLQWDISGNYGESLIGFQTAHSLNYSLGASSPRHFSDGALKYTQNIIEANAHQPIDWGLAYPVTLSYGGEYRRETWAQSPGSPASYAGSGAQGFSGFTPANAVFAQRHNAAVYAGLEADLATRFSAALSARHEHYSDFGGKTSGKLSARFAATKTLALRATAATGFRAPSLAQQRYQAISSVITNGVFYDQGTFATNSAAARALGAVPLKPETATSYSLGVVMQPLERLSLAVDAYQIRINDRIIYSSSLNILNNPAAQALMTRLGLSSVSGFSYFTNALDTRTRGVDVVGSYTIVFAGSQLDLTASYAANRTVVQRIAASPAVLTSLAITRPLVGRDEIGRVEDSYPKNKSVLSAAWKLSHWDVSLNATRYGRLTVRNASVPERDQRYGAKWIIDAAINAHPTEQWTITLGVDDLFDTYPDKVSNSVNSVFGLFPYSNYSPFGFNGAHVYGRIGYRW